MPLTAGSKSTGARSVRLCVSLEDVCAAWVARTCEDSSSALVAARAEPDTLLRMTSVARLGWEFLAASSEDATANMVQDPLPTVTSATHTAALPVQVARARMNEPPKAVSRTTRSMIADRNDELPATDRRAPPVVRGQFANGWINSSGNSNRARWGRSEVAHEPGSRYTSNQRSAHEPGSSLHKQSKVRSQASKSSRAVNGSLSILGVVTRAVKRSFTSFEFVTAFGRRSPALEVRAIEAHAFIVRTCPDTAAAVAAQSVPPPASFSGTRSRHPAAHPALGTSRVEDCPRRCPDRRRALR